MLCKCVFFIYFNFVLFPMVFHPFVSLILYILFWRRRRRVSKNVWMAPEDDTDDICEGSFPWGGFCVFAIWSKRWCVYFYILNLSFLHSLVDIYSFLRISCVFERKKRMNKPRRRYADGMGVKWTNIEGVEEIVFHPVSCCRSFIGIVSWGFLLLIYFCMSF
jgi:hypothetical protein